MKIRPEIVLGDLVRLSKKGKSRAPSYIPRNCQMIVAGIDGDGIDRSTKLLCRMGNEEYFLMRNEVWKTGFNAFEESNEMILDQDAPLNNSGRNTCYLCHMSIKDVCKNSNCRWFEN